MRLKAEIGIAKRLSNLNRRILRAAIFSLSSMLLAQQTCGGQEIHSDPIVRRGDGVDVAYMLDDFIPEELEARHLPGAVITVIRGDKLLVGKGYGWADIDEQIPVNFEETTFRVASVSKLFTTTALMQLYERGSIDLNDDVNLHLNRFQIDSPHKEPIRIRNLLTHTAGLEPRFLASRSRTRSGQPTLGDYLAAKLPAPSLPPGEVISYANHGMALAGFIVEEVDGRSFNTYVTEEILLPLSMINSSFDMPDALVQRLATGFVWSGGAYHPVPVDFRCEVPSGSLITTGADMVHFVRAQLSGGSILSNDTMVEMQSRQFTNYPGWNGVCYGFFEHTINGYRAIGHDGDIKGYSSRLMLVPDLDLGIFIAYTGTDVAHDFADLVTRRIVGQFARGNISIERASTATLNEPVARFAGHYRWTRYVRSTVEKLFMPYAHVQLHVSEVGPGMIQVGSYVGQIETSRYKQVAPLLFRQVDGQREIAFKEGEDGNPAYLLMNAAIPMAYEKIPRYQAVTVQAGLLFGYPIFFTASAFLLVVTGKSWKAAGGSNATTLLPVRLSLLAMCVLNVLFIVAFPIAFGLNGLSTDRFEIPPPFVTPGNAPFFYGIPMAARLLLVFPLVSALVLALAGTLIIRGWLNRAWTLRRSLAFGVLVVSGATYLMFLDNWNLIGFKF